MNELQVFKNEQFGEVKTIMMNDECYFVGKDVAKILGYSNTSDALSKHVDTEDKIEGVAIRYPLGGKQKPILINESGLYSLIMSSKLPQAKQFKKWVTSEVLPSIRKNGMYVTEEMLLSPEFAIKTFEKLRDEMEARKKAEAQIKADEPKVMLAEAVTDSEKCINIGELAKLLAQNGIDMGRRRLFQDLRDKGYLMTYGAERNQPKQKWLQQGLFKIVKDYYIKNGLKIPTTKTVVTGKGQLHFITKYLKEKLAKEQEIIV